ncbi:MAG: hypothetical protein KatS3mg105_2299 [Gemmatales bacterium]|nr:MAG: hypothetical protein KatS3mg105_2299 [Gemmatales bacterium]
MNLANAIKSALCNELKVLCREIHDLVSPITEEQLWAKPINPGNSVGHLLLHLAGNLNHFVGAHLGHTGYQRDRDREFNETGRPAKAEVLQSLDDSVATFERVVSALDEDSFLQPHPEARLGNVLEALIHLVAHFALHRGQMTYLIRASQS